MTYQSQANGYIAFKAQSALGSIASGASGFVLRTAGGQGGRLTKAAIESNEVRRDLMRSRGRHGTFKTAGTYTVEVSLDYIESLYEALFRGTWATALVVTEATSSLASITTTTTTIVAGGTGGSWISAGLRVGDVVVLTNHSTAGNNSRNLLITGLTATVMTVYPLDGLTLTLNAVPDTAFTVTRPGQKLINPAAGSAVKTYFTFEEYDADLDLTEIYRDCIITSLRFSMAPNGLLMCDVSWIGVGFSTDASAGSAPTFTSPTESVGVPLASLDAVLRVGASTILSLTNWDVTMEIGGVAPDVAASYYSPDVFTGLFAVSLNFTVMREDYAFLTGLRAETVYSMAMIAREVETQPTDFFSIFIPNFTLGGVDKSPLSKEAGPRTMAITVPSALVGKDNSGGAYDATMAKIQVSNS